MAADTIDCRYITVKFNTILHIMQLIRRYNFDQTWNSWITPISRQLWLSFVSYWRERDREISGMRCIECTLQSTSVSVMFWWLWINLSLNPIAYRAILAKHRFNGLGKDNCKTRRETFKFWNLVSFLLEIWQYVLLFHEECCQLSAMSQLWGTAKIYINKLLTCFNNPESINGISEISYLFILF